VELRSVLDPLIGKTVAGRHRLVSRLGTGGMSSVYLARHVLIDRLMAIKTLRRDLARDRVQRDRFLREARAANRINHPNIVEITDFGEGEDGLVYLVMEYVPGDSLFQVLADAPLPALRALDIAEQIGSALARAHQMGVIHRDLKPENILLAQQEGRSDYVKILDLGIAKIMDAPSLTGSQQIFGTPGYIAPEYIQSSNIDGRADLYSLGIILYEMVSGALPFQYEFPGDLLVKQITENPTPPSEHYAQVDPEVERLILRCLEKHPDERFRDAHHFLEELRRVRASLSAEEQPPRAAPQESSHRRAPHETIPDAGLGERVGSGHVQQNDAAREDEQEQPISARVPTLGYGGPAIPEAPSVEGPPVPVEVEVDSGAGRSRPPSQPVGPDRAVYGLLGVRRWRERFDAIQQALDEIELQAPAPAHVAQAMAFASRTLEEFEAGIAQCERHQQQLEALHVEVRELRERLGQAIDDAAGRLSQARGELEQMVRRRNELIDSSKESSEPAAEELDELQRRLHRKGEECDELEARLGDLRKELERRNEEFEGEFERLVQTTDAEMMRLESLAANLREPLDQVEAFIRERWEEHATPQDASRRPVARESSDGSAGV
jgi:serine/threonine-protein kinase